MRWVTKKADVIRTVIDALGRINAQLLTGLKKISINIRVEHLKDTVLFRTARVLHRVLEARSVNKCHPSVLAMDSKRLTIMPNL